MEIYKGRFYKELFYLRQDGDYDDRFDVGEKDIIDLVETTEKFIAEIEKLLIE